MGIDAETYAAAKAYVDHEIEGGGGTLDYEALRNHPSINGNELTGNKSSKQLGITNLWTGTQAEWAQLTADQKAQYTHVGFTDDTAQELTVIANPETTATAELTKLQVGQSVYSIPSGAEVTANAEAIEAMVNVNGAKNWALLEPESESKDGITFTCTDGKSLTLSGTASDNTGKSYNLATPITGDVIVTLEQTANKVTLSYNDGTDWHPLPADGKVNGTIVQVGFNMVSGTVINETVYLMIRDARITDSTYVPYAMTNRELTEKSKFKLVQTIECNNTYLVGSLSLYANELTRQCFLAGSVQTAYDDIVNLWRPIASIDTNYIPKAVAFNAVAISNSGGAVVNRGYVSKNTANAVVAYTIDGTHSAGNTVDIYLTWIY